MRISVLMFNIYFIFLISLVQFTYKLLYRNFGGTLSVVQHKAYLLVHLFDEDNIDSESCKSCNLINL